MKSRLILAVSVIMVLGLAIAAFAYQRTAGPAQTAMSCCMGDSCPMKGSGASGEKSASCCDMDDCCCKGSDSCPMKNKKGDAASNENKAPDAAKKDSCCACCKMDKSS